MTDSCPRCCLRGIHPSDSRRRDAEVVHTYRCPSCGHTWTTSRLRAAYPRRRLHAVPLPEREIA